MSVTITTDAWLAELERVQQETPAGYLSVSQMAERTGRSLRWIRGRLVELKREGRLALQLVSHTDLAGRATWVPAYRIVPKGKARKEEGR